MRTSAYAVVDPSTGELIREYPTATDEQVEQAVAAAAKAFKEWSRGSTVAERAALLRKVAELHTQRKSELAKIIQREMGKPLAEGVGECRGTGEGLSDEVDEIAKAVAPETLNGEAVTTTL